MSTTTDPTTTIDPTTDPTGTTVVADGERGAGRQDRNDSLAFFAIAFAALAVLTSVFAAGIAVRAVRRADAVENPPAAAASDAVTIHLTEFAITPKAITAPADGKLEIVNDGTTPHDFSVGDLTTGSLDPGKSALINVAALGAGEHQVICTVTGHKDSGMTATLTVA
jgi:plastocyanin